MMKKLGNGDMVKMYECGGEAMFAEVDGVMFVREDVAVIAVRALSRISRGLSVSNYGPYKLGEDTPATKADIEKIANDAIAAVVKILDGRPLGQTH